MTTRTPFITCLDCGLFKCICNELCLGCEKPLRLPYVKQGVTVHVSHNGIYYHKLCLDIMKDMGLE